MQGINENMFAKAPEIATERAGHKGLGRLRNCISFNTLR